MPRTFYRRFGSASDRNLFSELVAAAKDDRSPARIEGEREAPQPVETKPELLHVREIGAFERVDIGASKIRAELRQSTKPCQKLVLYRGRKFIELRLKFDMEKDRPRHEANMS